MYTLPPSADASRFTSKAAPERLRSDERAEVVDVNLCHVYVECREFRREIPAIEISWYHGNCSFPGLQTTHHDLTFAKSMESPVTSAGTGKGTAPKDAAAERVNAGDIVRSAILHGHLLVAIREYLSQSKASPTRRCLCALRDVRLGDSGNGECRAQQRCVFDTSTKFTGGSLKRL